VAIVQEVRDRAGTAKRILTDALVKKATRLILQRIRRIRIRTGKGS
jgi:hypothetical protein